MPKTLVILNPVSGHGHSARLWPSIETALREGGLAFDLVRTPAPRAAVAIAEKAKRDGYETLIAVGGDGTANEVVNGILRASKEEPSGTLGLISVGSGNDFIKMIPVPSSPGSVHQPDWREAVQRILRGNMRLLDVGKVTGDKPAWGSENAPHYFINGLDTGFGAHVAAHAHDFPLVRGTLMYLLAVFKSLVN